MIPVLVLLVALLGSAIFAGAETGYYATPALRLRMLARTSRRAAWLERISRSPTAWLCTLLVGNNLANDAAVHAAIAICQRIPGIDPHLIATVVLTPVVFLVGEVGPKQMLLARPLERSVALAPALVLSRVLLWPLVAPVAALLRRLRLESDTPLGRHEIATVLMDGHGAPGGARAAQAARRALDSRGRGLEPFLRTELPVVAEDASLEEARRLLAASPDALGLLAQRDGGFSLLRGERLAIAGSGRRPADLAEEMPQLEPDLDLSQALERLRAAQSSVALVGRPGDWRGICDLEFILGRLLASEAPRSRPQ
ncbi:MAG: DUF21 domain-containing protein [Planctomycetes bacterium]|nr:DUF21 domain-containing protein [Planctomycetota bacterium]MBL7008565.1 DUF21 domain-containing protein [Planctomycetota bacterium]